MSYTSNHTNSSVVNISNDGSMSTCGVMKLDTDTALMTGISKVDDTHDDSDDDDILWCENIQQSIKYIHDNKIAEQTLLDTLLDDLKTKMAMVEKHANDVIQHESLVAQNLKSSKKKKRKRISEIVE